MLNKEKNLSNLSKRVHDYLSSKSLHDYYHLKTSIIIHHLKPCSMTAPVINSPKKQSLQQSRSRSRSSQNTNKPQWRQA